MLAVAVCIGGGDVDEGLEVVHLLGQAEELLRGDHVQLQGVPAGKRDSHSVGVCASAGFSVCVCVMGICPTDNIYLHARRFCGGEASRRPEA